MIEASIRKLTVSRYLLFATENEELINVNFKSQTTMNLSYFSNLKISISARVNVWFPVRKVLAFCPGGSSYVLFKLTEQLLELGALGMIRSIPPPNLGPQLLWQ